MFLPSSGKKQQFNPFGGNRKKKRQSFDQIEDAEYEDLSDKNN